MSQACHHLGNGSFVDAYCDEFFKLDDRWMENLVDVDNINAAVV